MKSWLIAAVALAFSAPASAATHLAVTGQTDFPLDVGGGLQLELPGRLQLSGEAGVLPPAYVDAANNAFESARVYDANTGALVREALRNSLILRGHLGWRPFANHGFFLRAGYGVAELGGQVSADDVGRATGLRVPPGVGQFARLDIHSAIEIVDAQLGWQWTADHLLLSLALGGAHSVAARSTLSIHDGGLLNDLAAPLEAQGEELLDKKILQYGNTAELTFGVGFEI